MKAWGIYFWAGFIVLLTLVNTGCTKAGLDVNFTNSVSTYVVLMNMAPFSPSTEIYLNNAIATSAVAPGNFSSTYAHLTPGVYDVTFKVAGSDSILADIPNSAYDSSSFYTLILYNDDTVHKATKAVKVVDDFSQVTSSSSYFRFLHLSPSLPAVDVYLNNNKIMQNRSSEDMITTPANAAFEPTGPGLYTIQVKKAGTDSLVASLTNTDFLIGQAYTVFLCGSPSNPNFPVTINSLQASY